jgi:hypothetical protein
MSRSIEIAALAICLAQCPAGVAAAHAWRAARPEHRLFRKNKEAAHALVHASSGAAGAQQAVDAVPDWTVQYGQVTNPRGASGSFGAMLEGRNPAANAIP